ncbi:MAG TPA: hypothetical protein VE944_25180 [Nostoc sp.]|uniref:hypothetical protein n=1 Tax=Nostoc sp. TaxID=1180 RepID=UPI002D2585D1|nr:hypothetical protein [Nostoc sp.]HYX17585.1 hypothetical protein [Nostoc sp.]
MSVHPQIDEQITFFYTHNLNASKEFYEQKLRLKLWLNQGVCRIYTISDFGYLGLCQTSEISTPLSDKQSSVIFSLVIQQVDDCNRR